MNGSEEVAISGTFSSTGSFWINDIAPLKNSIVLGKLTAAYGYEIVGDDAKSWGSASPATTTAGLSPTSSPAWALLST